MPSIATAEAVAAAEAALQELETLKEISTSRAKDIEGLRSDRVRLGLELDTLRLKVCSIT